MYFVFTLLQVNIRVSVIDGVVHVNNTKAIHEVVTTFHFYAEIGKAILTTLLVLCVSLACMVCLFAISFVLPAWIHEKLESFVQR